MKALVPFWMTCVPLAVAVLYGPLTYGLLRAASWLALREYRAAQRKEAKLHWTDRARLSLGSRTFASVALAIMPLQAAFFANNSVGSLSIAKEEVVAWVTGLACFAGGYLALRELGAALGFKCMPLAYDIRATLFALHGVLIFGAAVLGFWKLGRLAASPGAGSFCGLVMELAPALLAIALLWGPVQTSLFRAFGLYREDRRLVGALEPVFQKTGIRPRALWVVRTSLANAFAYPLRQTIIVTERLLEVLTPKEVAAVVAHELGHLKEGRQAWLRFTLLWFVCATSFAYPFIDPDAKMLFFWTAFAVFFALVFALRAWSRRREHDADALAVDATDAVSYACALAKLYEVNLYPATQRGGSHPSLFDRLERAGITPDYPRPPLPSRKLSWPGLAVITLFPFFSLTWPELWRELSNNSAAVAAVVTERAHPLGRLALEAWELGDTASAIALYERAERLEPRSAWYPRNLAAVLNQAGDCRGAREAVERARVNAKYDPEVENELFTIECNDAAVNR